MSEPKVLHEWGSGVPGDSFRIVDRGRWGNGPTLESLYVRDNNWHEDSGFSDDIGAVQEIARLAEIIRKIREGPPGCNCYSCYAQKTLREVAAKWSEIAERRRSALAADGDS